MESNGREGFKKEEVSLLDAEKPRKITEKRLISLVSWGSLLALARKMEKLGRRNSG